MKAFQGKLEQIKMSDDTGRPKTNELKAQNPVKQTTRLCSMKSLKAIFFSPLNCVYDFNETESDFLMLLDSVHIYWRFKHSPHQ